MIPMNFLRSLSRAALVALSLAFAAAAPVARAQLTIEIVGGTGTAIPIAVSGFEGESAWPLGISGVVAADLGRSGLFRNVDAGGVVPRPARAEDVKPDFWRARGADAVVVGSMQAAADGRVEVRYALVDVVRGGTLIATQFVVTREQFRATAHRIADEVYEKLIGHPGVFSTRIAYIAKQGSRYQLVVADADGAEPQTVVSAGEPLLSPRWSPDGTRIAYVSLEQKKPVVYVQTLATGGRTAVAAFRGSNSAPAFSPDGRKLAVTLTRDGGSQLYLMNADGTDLRRILSSPSIDTEAWFMPDGRSLLFTSDRGGSPQIYRVGVDGGAVERITFDGSYNVAPRALPDGKGMVYVRRDGGRYQVATLDFATRQTQVLTAGPLDESPSLAPNGQLVLYANDSGGRGILNAVSIDGRVKQRIVSPALDVREPAWGPLAR